MIHLTLVNNDPTSTLLMTPAGQVVYSITTPPAVSPLLAVSDARPPLAGHRRKSSTSAADLGGPTQLDPLQLRRSYSQSSKDEDHEEECHVRRASTTIVTRLDGYSTSKKTTVGLIQPRAETEEDANHFLLDLCELQYKLSLPTPPSPQRRLKGTGDGVHSSDDGRVVQGGMASGTQHEALQSWDFIGPDQKQYKWHLVAQTPVLARIEPSQPNLYIARYRRAKLGLSSRSRKGFLEVYPKANTSLDFIVASFVGFMKQCVMPKDAGHPPGTPDIRRSLTSPEALQDLPSSQHGPDQRADGGHLAPTSIPVASHLPHRFATAVALARKHSKSPSHAPSHVAFSSPSFMPQPQVRQM